MPMLQVEQKIVAELREHGLLATPQQPHPRGPDYADLDKLTYLACVIKEAMRVHTVSTPMQYTDCALVCYMLFAGAGSLCWHISAKTAG